MGLLNTTITEMSMFENIALVILKLLLFSFCTTNRSGRLQLLSVRNTNSAIKRYCMYAHIAVIAWYVM